MNTDLALAKQIGQRIDQMRLEANLSQKEIAFELGITINTYKNLIQGKAKFENIIGVLRLLNRLDLVENFVPLIPFSPIELLKLKGNQRQRASKSQSNTKPPQGDLEW